MAIMEIEAFRQQPDHTLTCRGDFWCWSFVSESGGSRYGDWVDTPNETIGITSPHPVTIYL